MQHKKLVRIDDEQKEMLEYLKKRFKCSENSIFLLAIEKFYKDIKN